MGGTVSLYEVLKARKTGLSPDLYTLLRAQREMPERVITAEPPIYFKSDGTAISEYQISGDTVQSITPTPDNPVEVLGVGDRTANLFDGTYTKGFIGTTYIYKNTNTNANCAIIPCEPLTTYSVKKYDDSNRFAIGTSNVLPYDEIQLTEVYYLDTATTYTFTTDSSAHFMIVYVSTGTEQAEPSLMVNEGSTALPYEPYGYKIPITLNSVTQNVYLDEPLYSGDYIERNADGTGVLHQDGADTPIALPQLSTVIGSNELNISTTVTPEVMLKGKIKQLPDSDMNALLSVMEEM